MCFRTQRCIFPLLGKTVHEGIHFVFTHIGEKSGKGISLRQLAGNKVALSSLKFLNQIMLITRYIHTNTYTNTFSILTGNHELHTEVLTTKLEVTFRTIEGKHDEFAVLLNVGQVEVGRIVVGVGLKRRPPSVTLRLVGIASHDAEQYT